MERKRIGIVFALEQERRGLSQVLADARVVTWEDRGLSCWASGGTEMAATVSGIGGERSAQAARLLLDQGAEGIICAGFAAGLDPGLRVGDVLVARSVLGGGYRDAGQIACSEFGFAPPTIDIGYAVQRSQLVSHDSIVRTRFDKRMMHQTTGAGALDMESYAAAQVCVHSGVPFAAVRCISDAAEDELPLEVEMLAAAENAISRFVIAASSPRTWPALMRLRRQANLAAGNLGDFLGFQLARIGKPRMHTDEHG